MIKKYKKGDEVIVKVGKDKGKIGKIAKVLNSSDKVIISGVILVKSIKSHHRTLKAELSIKKCQFTSLIFWLMTQNLKNHQKLALK
jgi:ribosomal protein L24